MPPSPSDSRPLTYRWWIATALVLVLIPTVSISSAAEETRLDAGDPATSDVNPEEPGQAHPVVDQAFDAVVLRPLGSLAIVGGSIFFVVTSPLVLVSRVIDYKTSWDVLVIAPWEYTVDRPLGDL